MARFSGFIVGVSLFLLSFSWWGQGPFIDDEGGSSTSQPMPTLTHAPVTAPSGDVPLLGSELLAAIKHRLPFESIKTRPRVDTMDSHLAKALLQKETGLQKDTGLQKKTGLKKETGPEPDTESQSPPVATPISLVWQPVWHSFYSEISAQGFARHLGTLLEQEVRIASVAPGAFQVEIAVGSAAHWQQIRQQLSVVTGLEINNQAVGELP